MKTKRAGFRAAHGLTLGGLAILLATAARARADEVEIPVVDAIPDLPPELGPDQAPSAAPAGDRSDWGLEAQLWGYAVRDRTTPPSPPADGLSTVGRGVLGFRHEWAASRSWRLALSDRAEGAFDLRRADGAPSHRQLTNDLREARLGWQGGELRLFYASLGRINLRNGVGSGYNPTDFYKARAVRTAVSLDPNALRVDRLGAVALELQYIGERQAWTVAYVPRLAHPPATSRVDEVELSLGLDRTNAATSVLVKWAPRIHERLSIDLLVLAREHSRAGLNVSLLAARALTLNAEWSGGICRPLPAPSQTTTALVWCDSVAVNATWTMPFGLELTLEGQYASDALSAPAWREWRNASTPELQRRLGAILVERSAAREPVARSGLFVRAAWRDAFAVTGLHLSGFVQANGFDRSGLAQVSAVWNAPAEWFVGSQLVDYFGRSRSEFGSAPVQVYAGAYAGIYL